MDPKLSAGWPRAAHGPRRGRARRRPTGRGVLFGAAASCVFAAAFAVAAPAPPWAPDGARQAGAETRIALAEGDGPPSDALDEPVVAARLPTARPDRTAPDPPAPRPRDSRSPAAAAPAVPKPPPAPRPGESRTLVVKSGDTAMSLLRRAGIPRGQAAEAIAVLRKHHDPRRLAPGQELTVAYADPGGEVTLRRVALAVAPDRVVTVERREGERFIGETVRIPVTGRLVGRTGTIRASLYLAGERAEVPPGVLARLIRLFSWDVDFQREIRPGDEFAVAWKKVHTAEGAFVRDGAIVFGRMTLSGEDKTFYRFAGSGGADYYDRAGRGARKPLMRTPIDGARLSSGYGVRRHPILGYRKMHRGIDFAAPSGTPIYAAGDGRVAAAGRNGAYGKYVRIRHNARYQTAYAHMRAIRRGIRPGARVRQGQVIGYVGSTGRSTGPHLHYEILVNDRRVNPLKVKLPSRLRLRGAELAAFEAHRAGVDRELERLFGPRPAPPVPPPPLPPISRR